MGVCVCACGWVGAGVGWYGLREAGVGGGGGGSVCRVYRAPVLLAPGQGPAGLLPVGLSLQEGLGMAPLCRYKRLPRQASGVRPPRRGCAIHQSGRQGRALSNALRLARGAAMPGLQTAGRSALLPAGP